ncbi:MAG TPA: CopG family transcriptional regulator [Bryobacteraceae bacterium]|nr:CopG family transcriptional regulator [Bryobacteraceae bacterium]
MKRTQLYLEEHVWKVLQILSRQSGTSISDLVRQAVRERYVGEKTNREHVLKSVVGLWKDRRDLPGTESYVRSLRQGKRLERVQR